MATGFVIQFTPKNKAELLEFPLPDRLTGSQALIRQDYSVISAGTELANFNQLPNTFGAFPYFPGYRGAGTVVATGPDCKKLREWFEVSLLERDSTGRKK